MRNAFPFVSRPFLRLAAIGIVAALAGCVIGSTPRSYGPAQTAGGVTTRLRVRRSDASIATVRGELLLATDSSLIVRAEHGVIYQIPIAQVDRAVFPDASSYGFTRHSPLSEKRRRDLRMFARFPYGIEPAVMDSLLARERQPALYDVDTPGSAPGIPTEVRVLTDGDAQVWVRGELLVVEDTALLIRTPGTIVRTPFRCITEASFEALATPAGIGRRGVPNADARRQLAQRARYPAPLTEAELRRLLPPNVAEPMAVPCAGGR